MLILEDTLGFVLLQVSGEKAASAFKNEAGGHRFQRVPPTERRGRVHTSTITVAILEVPQESRVKLDERDLEWKAIRASGPGGQNVNKVSSAVQLRHLPSGIQVSVQNERSQFQNLRTAKIILSTKLEANQKDTLQKSRNETRKNQLGAGMRGSKRRTIALQRDLVVDHVLEKRMSAAAYLKGNLEPLYDK